MMATDKSVQIIVLEVIIDSPRRIQVSVGKTRYEVPNARNRTDHILPTA